MKKSLLAITLLFAVGFVALPSASADSCDVPGFIKDFVKNLKDECKKLDGPQASTSTCTKNEAKLLKLVDKWNTLVQNSPLRLGPRDTAFGQEQVGTVVAPGDRQAELLTPDDNASAPAGGILEFRWSQVEGAVLYRIEFRDSTGSLVMSPIALPGVEVYSAPSWLKDKLNGRSLQWRVVALDKTGSTMSESATRRLRIGK